MDLNDAAFGTFAICNAFRVLAYLPQIVSAARDSNSCSSISCSTWSMLLIANLSAVWHVLANLDDAFIATTFAANAFCCFLIVGITWSKRLSYSYSRMKSPAAHQVLGAR